MTRRILALVALLLTLDVPAIALDIRSSTTPGANMPGLTNGEIAINRADKRLIFKNVDGSLGYGSLLNALPSGRKAVEQGDAGDLAVTANGATRSIYSWLYGLAYDGTADVIRARTVPGFNGDDAPALNAVLAAYPTVTLRAPTGAADITFNLKTTVSMPLVNQRLYGLSGPQGVVFHRDPSNTGDLLQIGSPTKAAAGARAAVVEDVFFTHDGRSNWLAHNPGVFTLPNRLTGGQNQVSLYGGQGARLKIGGYGGQYFVSIFGGAGNVIDTPFIYGGVWDADHAGLQEGIAQIRFTNSTVHGHGTSGRVRDPIMYGAGYTESRTYTVGNKWVTSKRRNGPLYGILVESLEDGSFTGGFAGLYPHSAIAIIPKDASSFIQNIEVAHMNLDESNVAGVYARRGDPSYAVPNTINIHDNTFNGQAIGQFGIFIDGDNGNFAVVKFKEHHNTYRAHLGASVKLTGVDGGQSDNNRLAGYNLSLNDTMAGGALDASSGRFIGGITRNHVTINDTAGGGPNADVEANSNQRAYADLTSGQGNTYASIRPAFAGTQSGVKALNLAGGGLIFGGKPAQGSLQWTPVITAASGSLTSYTIVSAAYTRNPDSNWITAKAEISIPSNGTGANYVAMTLPAASASTGGNVGVGRENARTGKALQVFVPATATAAQIYNFDGSYPAASGSYLVVEVTYEAVP